MTDDDECGSHESSDSDAELTVGDTSVSISDFAISPLPDDVEMEALSAGLDPELAKDLGRITSDDEVPELAEVGRPTGSVPSFGESPPMADAPVYESYSVDVDVERANTLLKTIYTKLQQRMNEGFDIEVLVLGLPQFHVLEPWAHAEHGHSIEDVLPVSQVMLVPGPMIHPVVPNKTVYCEYLAEEVDDA